ncbi:MAG: acylphosphatase [Proteobacteria bacterium]|nr:acylphosphatase [Pseudomonadota bacterium]
MSAQIGRCYRIVGRVQGVYFRGSARCEALRLGIRGWAQNLADGSVEVHACGAADAMLEFESWLGRGPRHAEVHHVESTEANFVPPKAFEVR